MDQDTPSDTAAGGIVDNPAPAADVPTDRDHLPGAPDADGSEPQIPRLGEGGAAPGAHDPSRATPDEPVASGDVAGDVGTDPEAEAIRQERGAPTEEAHADPGPDAGSAAGAGRAVNAAFARNRQPQQQQQARAGAGEDQQQQDVQGAGYPTADRDGRHVVDPTGDVEHDMDPEASHAVPEAAPAEDGVPEDAPADVSLVGEGHADKAAWNRERTSHPQPGYDAVVDGVATSGRQPGSTPGSSEDMGYPGGAPSEGVPGLDTGDGRLDELTEDAEAEEDESLEDAADALDDDTTNDLGASLARLDDDALALDELPSGARGEGGLPGGQGRRTFLPEHRDQPDEGRDPIDLVIADDNEDAMFAAGELGDAEDLEMEDLNETDDIARDFEDQRADLDSGASGNERQGL